MSHSRDRQGWRSRLPGRSPEEGFRWQGREVSRLEGFADAVFAFAITLLVVSLEVPRGFDGFMEVIRGFPAFIASFLTLVLFWNAHYHYFRRYGLEDAYTRWMTLMILLMVLFAVYPLKFLFGLLLPFGSVNAPHIETWAQLKRLYVIYGLGLGGLYSLYMALYFHALRLRRELGLSEIEVILTEAPLWNFAINVLICLISVTIAVFEWSTAGPGIIYSVLVPLFLTLNGWWHRRRVRAVRARQEQRY